MLAASERWARVGDCDDARSGYFSFLRRVNLSTAVIALLFFGPRHLVHHRFQRETRPTNSRKRNRRSWQCPRTRAEPRMAVAPTSDRAAQRTGERRRETKRVLVLIRDNITDYWCNVCIRSRR